MARGDAVTFEEFVLYFGKGEHDFSSDTFNVYLITNASAPTAADVDPTYDDWTECTPGGAYSAKGSVIGSTTYTEAGGVGTFDGANVTWSKTAGSPTDAYYAVVFNDTNGSDRCVQYIDLGGPVSIVDGDLVITWHADGIEVVTVTQ